MSNVFTDKAAEFRQLAEASEDDELYTHLLACALEYERGSVGWELAKRVRDMNDKADLALEEIMERDGLLDG